MRKAFVVLLLLIFTFSLSSCKKDDLSSLDERFDEDFLVELNDILEDAERINNIYGVSISYEGEIVSEKYFGIMDAESDNNVYSVTKSVISLLVGKAIEEGYIDSLDQSISDFIDLDAYDTVDDLSVITIKHLLTMSAGLVWDSDNLSGEMINLRSNSDPLNLILGRELGFTPGTRFNYSDGSAHLISVILKEATGKTALEYGIEHLFAPLGIDDPQWNTDRLGNNIGGCDLFLSNTDMDIIGNLILNGGIHNSVRIIEEDWIETSTVDQTISYPNYGYYWWLGSELGNSYISARGWGGQQIFVIPDLNIVITTSANGWVSDTSAHSQFDQLEDLVVNEIIPLFDGVE